MEMLQKLIALLAKIFADSQVYLAAASALLVALIGLFALIPGDQPEKALQKVVDFIGKLSLKKKE